MWVGRPLSWVERLSMLSFAHAGHAVEIYTLGGEPALPDGIRRRDVTEVLPELAAFANPRQPGTFASYSNLFRYRLLQQHDTTWVDTDVVLVSPGLPDGPYLFGFQGPGHVASGVLRAPRDSRLLELLVDRAFAMDPASIEWGQMGPDLLTTILAELDLTHLARPQEELYPVRPLDVWLLFQPDRADEADERVSAGAAVHLWHELLRRAGPVTSLAPPAGSWLDRKLIEVGVPVAGLDRLDAEWVARVLGRNGPVTAERLERVTRERDAARERVAALRRRVEGLEARVERLKGERDALRERGSTPKP